MSLARPSFLLSLFVLLTIAAPSPPALAQPAGTLVVGLVAEPVNLDPPQVTDINSLRVSRRIAETLVTFLEESTQIVPGLAESWTISLDGLWYTFKLRRGIKFHDGTPFNAEAVKFSIERQFNPEHPANEVQIAATSKRVQGFKLHPSFDLRVETISLR